MKLIEQKDIFQRATQHALRALIVVGVSVTASLVLAEEGVSLDTQLETLKLPENAAPLSVSRERLYSVQNRYSNLRHRSEINVGGARNFSGSTFVSMSQIDLAYRFHLNNRWNLSASGSYAFNKLTNGADELFSSRGLLPDAAYMKSRADLLVGYHLFYGKLRFSMDRVAYFDHYIAVGPGVFTTQYGSVPAAVADIGMAFWMGKKWTARMGFKNAFFKEQRMLSSSNTFHMLGHIDFGYLFGNGASL